MIFAFGHAAGRPERFDFSRRLLAGRWAAHRLEDRRPRPLFALMAAPRRLPAGPKRATNMFATAIMSRTAAHLLASPAVDLATIDPAFTSTGSPHGWYAQRPVRGAQAQPIRRRSARRTAKQARRHRKPPVHQQSLSQAPSPQRPMCPSPTRHRRPAEASATPSSVVHRPVVTRSIISAPSPSAPRPSA